MNRRTLLKGFGGMILIYSIPTKTQAAGSSYATKSEKTAFQDVCLRRIEGLNNYIEKEIPNFSNKLNDLELNYSFPKELIQSIVAVEGGTPWLGASKSTPYFQKTNGTGWKNGKLRAAAGLPQMFNPAFKEAKQHAIGKKSLIRNSPVSRTQMILEEMLPNEIPTVPYQLELIPAYLTRLLNWIRPTGSNEEKLIVLSQAYNSGVGGIFDNYGRSQTGNLAQILIDNPTGISYPNKGVDKRYAQKVYDVSQRL